MTTLLLGSVAVLLLTSLLLVRKVNSLQVSLARKRHKKLSK